MVDKKRNILFHLVIHHPDSRKEVRYIIFDRDPSFASLSSREKKFFIRKEDEKIKRLISKKYRPHHLSSSV